MDDQNAQLNTGLGASEPTPVVPMPVQAPQVIPVQNMQEREANVPQPAVVSVPVVSEPVVQSVPVVSEPAVVSVPVVSEPVVGTDQSLLSSVPLTPPLVPQEISVSSFMSKNKKIIIGVLGALIFVVLIVLAFMLFNSGEDAVTGEKNTLSSEVSPPGVTSPFSEEAKPEVEVEVDTEPLEAPELSDLVEEINSSAPPALDLIKDPVELTNDEPASEEEPSVPVKRVSR